MRWRWLRFRYVAPVLLVTLVTSPAMAILFYTILPPNGAGKAAFAPPRHINPADVGVPCGYCVEPVALGLTYPSAVVMDDSDRVYVVDWPWARIGAAFVDWVAMAPSVTMQGGPAPEDFFRRFDVDDVAASRVDAVLCSFAGFFVVRGLEPDPPGLPTLRAFQRAQGAVAVKWLRDRLAS